MTLKEEEKSGQLMSQQWQQRAKSGVGIGGANKTRKQDAYMKTIAVGETDISGMGQTVEVEMVRCHLGVIF